MGVQRFADLVGRLTWALQVVSELALLGLLGLVVHEVFVRYVLDHPTQYSVEYSEYLLVLITFASAAWTLRENRHVRVRLVIDRLAPRHRARLDALSYLLLALFCSVLVWQGGDMAWTAYQGGDRSSSLLSFPLWIAYGFIPLGALVLGLQCIVKLAESLAFPDRMN